MTIQRTLELLLDAGDYVHVHELDFPPRRLARRLWRRSKGQPQIVRIILKEAAVRLLMEAGR